MNDRLRPTLDATLMDVAHVWAQRSTCSVAQVGAVIALDGRTLSSGYNGAPSGMPHCVHERWKSGQGVDPPTWLQSCIRDSFNQSQLPPGWVAFYDGLDVILCDPEQEEQTRPTCRISTHAEVNAIAWAARRGVATNGATLYTTLTPCLACAKLIINAGIERVLADRLYRDESGMKLLRDAGLEIKCYQEL